MRAFCCAVLTASALFGGLPAARHGAQGSIAASQEPAVDPDVRAAVQRFYAAQEAEDVEGYLSLWSMRAQRPRPDQLKFIFGSGDDRFTGITVRRVVQNGERVRLRVSVVRERTDARLPPGSGGMRVSAMDVSLTLVREDGAWKLWREGTPADGLAGALMDAASANERDALLSEEPDLVGPGLLNAVSQRASQAAQLRVYAEAERLFDLVIEIARRTGDREAEGEAFQNLANTFYFRGRHPEALAAYEQRLAIERERNDDEAIASALLGIATVRYALAEYGAALEGYREALAIQERLTDAPALATTLISTGNVLYLQGDYEAAIADYRRSLTIGHARSDANAQTRALEGLGRVFAAQGNFAEALDAFSAVLADATARNDRSKQATALQYVGEIHFKLGNLDQARTSYDTSRAHYEASKDAANAGRVWQAIALTDLVAGRFELAEKEYTQSLTLCGGATDDECVAGARVGVAFAQTAQEKYAQAIRSYEKAIAAFTAQGQREEAARAHVGSAQAYAGAGDLDEALAAAVRGRREAVALGAEDVLWRALLMEARVLRRKRDASALGAARAAVAAVERLQQAANERPGSQVPSDGDAAFATLAVIQAEAGDAAAAFATAEQMRLYRLRATLAPNERDIARGATPEEREEERAAAAQLVTVGAQLARERSLPKPDASRVARLEKTQEDALKTRAAQQRRLFERLPGLRVWRGLGSPATASDLDRVLAKPGAVLLEFVADEDDLLTLVAARGETAVSLRAAVTSLSRRTLAERVTALLQPSKLGDPNEWVRAAGAIAAVLPPDAVARLSNASSVLVVPDAGLWRVPFEALRIGDRYLGDEATVAYSSSITAALQARESGPRRPEGSLLAVAAPEIAPALRDRMLQTSPGWTVRSAEAAEQEVMALRPADLSNAPDPDSEPQMVLLRDQATEARLREAAPDATRLHLAVPFRVNPASPMFSPLLMGGDSPDSANDGLLEAREIINMDLGAGLAVLSDGSALAMRDAGRALDAIEWAWRSAGVGCVLLARWGTDGDAAAALLEAFHANVAGGQAPADALRAARAALRDGDTRRAPLYWAGWLLIAPPGAEAPAR